MHVPPATEIESFYRAAALGLRYLDAQEGRGRRFGEAALAGWRALGGEFEDRDRLDLLLRDAAANNPTTFAPRAVFGMTWLAEDEPFGPDWPQAASSLASSLLREGEVPSEALSLMRLVAEKWRLVLPGDEGPLRDLLGAVGPATRLVLAGSLAATLIGAQATGRAGLDLGDQVVLVADSAAERQLFGFALLVSGAKTRPKIVRPTEDAVTQARALGCSRVDVALVSADASPSVRAAAMALKKDLGG